jgi:putative glutamine amidotransferase
MPTRRTPTRPIVGITLDAEQLPTRVRLGASWNYADCVARAGGVPLMLPPVLEQVQDHADLCDAFVLTGGDDPCTEPFGEPTHQEATRVLALRQDYETALLKRLATAHRDKPVLGVCLGMQMMALVAGGRLNQHLPETHEHAGLHWDHTHAIRWCGEAADIVGLLASPIDGGGAAVESQAVEFEVRGMEDGENGAGENGAGNGVHSRHRQAVDDPGSLLVLARAGDGVIEAIADPDRAFYLGVQWHPERTASATLGAGLFGALIDALGQPTA